GRGKRPDGRGQQDAPPAVKDERIARVLAALAARPAEPWTVARLAKIAALSRAAFARRFVAEVGESPLRHLAALRIRRAAALLATGDATLAAIAAEAGYP